MKRLIFALWLALSSSLAWGQVDVPEQTAVSRIATLRATNEIPEGAKVKRRWSTSNGSLDIVASEAGDEAYVTAGKAGRYAVVLTEAVANGDNLTLEDYSATVVFGEPGPEPPKPEPKLRDLVTAAEAAVIAEYFRDFAGLVSKLQSNEQFWSAYTATFPVKGNAKLDTALKLRLDVLLAKPLELSKDLIALADEFAKPAPPEPPEPPIVETGKRAVVIVHETGDNNPDFGSLQIALQRPNSTSQKYLKQGGHTLDILDDELPGKWNDLLKGRIAGMALPALFVIDPRTNEVLFGQSIPNSYTADNVIERLRENGG